MKIAPLPANERARLDELRQYHILDTEPETAFTAVVELASYITQTPIAAISLVDENRQWFKAIVGINAGETPRDVAFCAHAILQDDPLVVPNALQDERFADNPLVAGGPEIRFYAGFQLTTSSGYNLGTLCVIDTKPRELTGEQIGAIRTLADSVMAHLDLRLSHQQIRKYVDDLQLAASVFDSATEAMLVTDADNRIITVNPAFTATTGYALEEVRGRNPSVLSSGKQSPQFYQAMWDGLRDAGRWSGELWNKRKNGELYAEWLSINVLYNEDGAIRLHLGVFSDVTEKKRTEEIIWRQANYDHLTQLANRQLFINRLEHEIQCCQRNSSSMALLFMDLDLFKFINDTLGHGAGDMLLVQAAHRIREAVRATDMVGRMGGDEFTALLPQVSEVADVERVAQKVLDRLSEPFELNGERVVISASVGYALYPGDASNAADLIRNADRAMYQAKKQGRGRLAGFQPE